MGLKRFIFLFLFLLLFIALYTVQSTISHEYLHQLIFAKYGIDSNVTYNFGPAFKEQLQDTIHHFRFIDANVSLLDREPMAWVIPAWNTTGNCTETCRLLHTQVEISDNQTENIVQTLFVLTMLFILWDYFKNGVKKKKEVEDDIECEDCEQESDVPRFDIKS